MFFPDSLKSLALIVGLGLSRSFSTLLFVRACQLAKSQRIATLNYAQAVFGYGIDVLLYGYSLAFIEYIAIVTVLATGAITFVETHKQAKT
jgi:drug/metabolite transporter (DMT)-like permease